MIRYSKKEAKELDKLLKYLFIKNSPYEHIENGDAIDFKSISATRKQIKKDLNYNDTDLNKYLQILYNRNTETNKFINKHKDRYFIMDLGIEFYYIGGFIRERKNELNKRNINITSLIIAIISAIGVFFSIYFNWKDTKDSDKKIEEIENRIDKIEKHATSMSNSYEYTY